jgi:hypothetical protein
VGLCTLALVHDPEPNQSYDQWHGLHARDSVAGAASFAMDSRGQSRAGVKRQPAAIGLTVQMFAGAGLGIAAQALLAWGLIFHVMPWIGLDLLNMARAVATFDLPARVGQLFAGFLALK